MSLDAPPAFAPAPAAPKITWREIAAGLWVGRAQDQHAGIIERGKRFTFTDAEGTVHPGFESLAAAQDAATGPIRVVDAISPAVENRTPRTAVLLAAATGVIGAGTIVLCGVALSLLP